MQEKFSYTKLDTYKQCGFKYKLKYIDGHYLYNDNIATDVGKMIHSAEESIANILINDADAKIDYINIKNTIILKSIEIAHKYPEAYDSADKSGKTYREKVNEYLTSGVYRLEKYIRFHTGYKVIAAELPFNFLVGDKLFTGFIDRIIKDEQQDMYIVQDIKTYAVPIEEKELNTLPLQFVVYSLAVMEKFNIPADKIKCQYDLPFCNIIQEAGNKPLDEENRAMLVNILKNIDNKVFEPHPQILCHWCEFCATNPNQPEAGKNLCPYHALWTRENKTLTPAMPWLGIEQHEAVLQKYISGNF